MDFLESLRLAIALGLTLFLVLLRFDSDRIIRSDYFRYRSNWLGPASYYALVLVFAFGIALILKDGRHQLFLTGGDPDRVLPVMLLFVLVAPGTPLSYVLYAAVGAGFIWLAHSDNIDRLLHGTERKFDLGLLGGKRSGGR